MSGRGDKTAQRVLVVGAGLAGAALLRGLANRGVSAECVEADPSGGEVGAGLLLTGNALEALRTLGLADAVANEGLPVSELRFADGDDCELFRLEVGLARGWPPFVSISRSALVRALHEQVPGVRAGVALEALAFEREGLCARLSDGTEQRYDLVIGADGAASRVRALAFGPGAGGVIPGFLGWRFVARVAEAPEVPTYWLGNGRTLLVHPLRGGSSYCGAGPVDEACVANAEAELERVRSTFAPLRGRPAAYLAALPDGLQPRVTRYWEISQVPWRRGRCVLIGDAAHACAPTLAQGAALAFEDAVVLSELLAHSSDVDAALDEFERSRRVRVEAIQRQSRARMDANRRTSEREQALRDQVLRAVGAARLEAAWAPLVAWDGTREGRLR